MATQTQPLAGTWALILGASSGFGEAVSLELAGLGMHILGVHLDRKSTMANVDRIVGEIKGKGRDALFFNVNAADLDKRREVLDAFQARAGGQGVGSPIRVMLHSLAHLLLTRISLDCGYPAAALRERSMRFPMSECSDY